MASFQKLGDKWMAQVFKRGVRRSQRFSTKAAAMSWAHKLQTEIESGASVGRVAARGTLGELIDRCIDEVKPVKRWKRTKDYTLLSLKNDIGRLKLTDLTSQESVNHAKRRAKEGAGPVSIQMEFAYLGNVFRIARAVWRLDIPQDLVPDIREALKLLGLVGKSRKRSRVAKDAELAAIKLAWRSEVPPSIIDFAIASCMRLSEIVGVLRMDRDGSVIRVRDRKHPTEKVGNDGVVPLLNGAAAILDDLPTGGSNAGRYFPYPADTVGAAWQRACKRAGVRDLRFHDLRHTGLTRLRKQGLGIPELAVVSGHRDWTMLQRYVHVTATDLLPAEDQNARSAGSLVK